MQTYTFKTRESVTEFLGKYNFKYYIPRLEQEMENVPVKEKYYAVEVTNGKVSFCCVDRSYYDGYSMPFAPFYDNRRPWAFPLKDQGEKAYIEWLEYTQYL